MALSAAELVTSRRTLSQLTPLRRRLLLVLITKCDDCCLLVHTVNFFANRVHRGVIIHVTHIQTWEVDDVIALTEVLWRPLLLLDTVRVEAIASSFDHLCGHSHLFSQLLLLLLPLLIIFRIFNSYQLVCLFAVTVLLTFTCGNDGGTPCSIRWTVGIWTDLTGLVAPWGGKPAIILHWATSTCLLEEYLLSEVGDGGAYLWLLWWGTARSMLMWIQIGALRLCHVATAILKGRMQVGVLLLLSMD